ncbi:carboxymuconolactone decarboxylase family protein [Roseovarius atlanticus]|nr:carboxymuconolactone decarboxylase family protein [Roseovarius atlanticus]
MTRQDTGALSDHVALALDAGVTAAEISETITHLAFYTGCWISKACARP